ncbi:DEAD/DEAH box helicase [Streptomyces radicis]|uniref:DEAD/DEAH box helicase n=1 Tax=Streptomyces radicis TaxID=1750517 RepID=UPI0038B4CA66
MSGAAQRKAPPVTRQARSEPRRRRAPRAESGGDIRLRPSTTPVLPAVHTFAAIGLPTALTAELTHQGITVPFPVQAAAIPNALAGRDILGRGRTGSGKTLAFGLPLLANTAGSRAESRSPLALVLVPTRELAQQVTEALRPYARAVRLRVATVVGGLAISRQGQALRDGAEIVVATPGRLNDLVERGDCRLDHVRIAVLDEADQMSDMGFLPQVTRLLRHVPADGQRMLFSATLDRDVERLTRQFLNDPVLHSVDPPAGAVSTLEHHVLHVTEDDKPSLVLRVAARKGRVIMFLGTKHAANRLAKRLLASGVRAAALHGGKSQPQRTRTLEAFKSGDITVLVATNVAARGIHVDDVDLVVNVDPPADHKDYLHRGGRTARAGSSGRVVTLVLPGQRGAMTRQLKDAGISAHTAAVRPDDAELVRITGARTPSGVPVTLPVAAAPAASSPAVQPSRQRPRASRPRGQGKRRATAATGRRSGRA